MATPQTRAEWELGIPPEPTIRSQTIFRVGINTKSVLSTWAMNQESTPTFKM